MSDFLYSDYDSNITSDLIIQLEEHLNRNLKIIYNYDYEPDSKTYKFYKIDKWIISKLLRIIYNFEQYQVDEINYENYSETEYFTEFETCFEFIWEQILYYFKYSSHKFNMDKDSTFNIFFSKYFNTFVERFKN